MTAKREKDKYYIDGGFCVTRVKQGAGDAEHTHDFLEIVYILSGNAVHYVDGREYPLAAGDALFINYGSTHRIEVTGRVSYANILLKPSFISESLAGVENAFALLDLDGFRAFAGAVDGNGGILHFTAAERRSIEGLIELAATEHTEQRPGKELLLRALLNALLTLVFRKMAFPMKPEPGPGAELLRYIRENCASPLTLEGLAAEAHYDPSYFSRLFKRRTGCTFSEYLTRCRIELAEGLLRDTELRVGEVAEAAGFSDRTKFHRAFAAHTGCTPLQYRKSNK